MARTTMSQSSRRQPGAASYKAAAVFRLRVPRCEPRRRADLVVANGHIDDTVRNIRGNVGYAQPPQNFLNNGQGKISRRRRNHGRRSSAKGRSRPLLRRFRPRRRPRHINDHQQRSRVSLPQRPANRKSQHPLPAHRDEINRDYDWSHGSYRTRRLNQRRLVKAARATSRNPNCQWLSVSADITKLIASQSNGPAANPKNTKTRPQDKSYNCTLKEKPSLRKAASRSEKSGRGSFDIRILARYPDEFSSLRTSWKSPSAFDNFGVNGSKPNDFATSNPAALAAVISTNGVSAATAWSISVQHSAS